MVTPLVKHKIVKKRLKPFLRNQSDGKLAMGVRAPAAAVQRLPRGGCGGSGGAACAQAAPPLPGTSARAASAFLATVLQHAAPGSGGRCGRARSGQHEVLGLGTSGTRVAAPTAARCHTAAGRLSPGQRVERHAAPPPRGDACAAPTP